VRAKAINDDGDVLCTFIKDGVIGAYVFNPLVDSAPLVLPVVLYNDSWLALNNSLGDRPAQVVGHLPDSAIFRYTLGDAAPEVFAALSYESREDYLVMGINDMGVVSGRRVNKSRYQAISFDGSTVHALNAMNGGADINESGDMAIWGNPELYHEGTGLLNLSDVVVGDSADLALWTAAGWRFTVDLTERGALNSDAAVADYPAVAGYLSGGGVPQQPYILLPVAP
jgi:hypothetical protein